MVKLLGFLSSKTVWTQLVGYAATIGALYGFDVTPEAQATLIAGLTGLWALVNFVVRYFTKEPMAAKEARVAEKLNA